MLPYIYVYTRMQLLQELSPVPCTADINFAKKSSITKRNRYKDRFPCESHFSNFIHLVCIKKYRLQEMHVDYCIVYYVHIVI